MKLKNLNRFLFVASVVFLVQVAADAKTWQVSNWSGRNSNSYFTYAMNNASDGDIIEITKNLTVNSDIQVYKDVTVRSAGNNTYTITNKGRYYICNIHPGGKLTLTNIVVDCDNYNRRVEDLFNLNEMEIETSRNGTATTNIARMVLQNGAVIQNVYLSSNSGTENAAIHIKKGAVLRIQEGAMIKNCNNQSVPGKGGAICCDYGTIIMTGGTITGCKSKSNGGAIHTDGQRIDAPEIEGLSARGDIYISGGYITNNTCASGKYGGAIYLGNSGPMIHITGSPIISNNVTAAGIKDDISTFELKNEWANRLKLTGHSDVNPTGFTTNGITFTGWVGVRYPDSSKEPDPQGIRFGGEWEYFAGTQEEPRQFYWNGNYEYRGRLEGNSLVWSKHVVHELPRDGEVIAELIESGAGSPLYIELNDDYEMKARVDVPQNYQIIVDLQGHEFKCDFHVENTTGQVVIRDSSIMKSGKVSGHRESSSPTAFVLEGGSYQTFPPDSWIAANRIRIGNYCEVHPYMVATLAWETNQVVRVADLTTIPLTFVDNEVREVGDKNELDDITFSTGDWVNMMHTNANLKAQVFVAPAVSNDEDGLIEVGDRVLLYDSDLGINSSEFISSSRYDTEFMPLATGAENEASFGTEDVFFWDAPSYDLVKLIHITLRRDGENYVTNAIEQAYFRFPKAAFEATQRKTNGKLPITVVDQLLGSLGYNRAAGFSKENVNATLDAKENNGLRKWENIVTGTAADHLLVSSVEESDNVTLKVSMTEPNKSHRGDTGYSVFYDLKKSTDTGWVRVGEVMNKPEFSVELIGEDGKSKNASGFYRVTTLIVPNDTLSVTNEIPSTNIIGVLEVASSFTNTMAAVPFVALSREATTLSSEPLTISKYLHTKQLKNNDLVRVANNGHVYQGWSWNSDSKKWEGLTTATAREVVSPQDPESHQLSRNNVTWVTRSNPTDKPFFIIGQYSPDDITLTIAAGAEKAPVCTLVPNPSLKTVKINEDYDWGYKPHKDDQIRIINEKEAPIQLFRHNGKWFGWFVDENNRSYLTDDISIPAGHGFWYHRCGDSSFELTLPTSKPIKE